MHLTPEEQATGRRNFLRAIAGVPVVAGLGAAALARGPITGGPVRIGYIGVGGEGRVLLGGTEPAYARVVAMADINPAQLALADVVLEKGGHADKAVHYAEWREMIQKESLEGVVIATPLWSHAEIVVGCLEAGLHVLCEKMMAWDVEGAERMRATARRTGKILEIGYQRNYSAVYQAAWEGIVKAGVLGDVFLARLAWHRNGNWRRHGRAAGRQLRSVEVGLPDLGASPQLAPLQEVLARPARRARQPSGQHQQLVLRHRAGSGDRHRRHLSLQGRPRSRRPRLRHVRIPRRPHAVFSTIESNAFERNYEVFYGTKATLLLQGESEAYLFDEATAPGTPAAVAPTGVTVQPKGTGPALSASESRAADAAGRAATGGSAAVNTDRLAAYKAEVSGFCSAIRAGTPLLCGPDRAIGSAIACITAVEAVAQKTRLPIRHAAAQS